MLIYTIRLWSIYIVDFRYLARFFTDLNRFFSEESRCGEIESFDDYQKIIDHTTPLSIEQVWKRWFTVSSDNDVGEFVKYLKNNQRFLDVKVSEWTAPNLTAVANLLNGSSNSNNTYSPPFSSIQPNYHRVLNYKTPIKVPFVPSHIDSTELDVVKSISNTKLVIKSTSDTPFFGVNTRLVKILEQTPQGTNIIILLKIFITGTVLPRQLIESKTLENLTNFYKLWTSLLQAPQERSDCDLNYQTKNSKGNFFNRNSEVILLIVCLGLVLAIIVSMMATLQMTLIILAQK